MPVALVRFIICFGDLIAAFFIAFPGVERRRGLLIVDIASPWYDVSMWYLILALLIFAVPALGWLIFAGFVVALPLALVLILVMIVNAWRSPALHEKGPAELSAEVFTETEQAINRKHLKENLSWLQPDGKKLQK